MKTTHVQSASPLAKTSRPASAPPLASKDNTVTLLRARLAEAENTLGAIRTGEVDTLVVTGLKGPRVFTLAGAEQVYRDLIESMNEGALTLTDDKTILYANRYFARMVQCPLEQVIGGSFRRFLSPEGGALLRSFLQTISETGDKIQTALIASDGSQIPVQISLRAMTAVAGQSATIGMVVTDLTEAHRTEELMQALTHRVVQVQEAERASVALELHDQITQPLCAALFSSQTLADSLAALNLPAKAEAVRLRHMLGETAAEVERISRDLRPGVLEHLGLAAVVRTTTMEFGKRTGVTVKLSGAPLVTPLPAEAELALYRILQEALKNIEKHARARQVTVDLQQRGTDIQLLIADDGIGFDAEAHDARRKGKFVVGMLAMRERAAYVGGTLTMKSGAGAGTEILARIPLAPVVPAAA